MKTYSILFIAAILVAGIGCKKNTQENKPPVEIPPPGGKVIVTTIAGDGTKSFRNGAPLTAQFSIPYDVAVATGGTVYVADAGNHQVRRIHAGQVSTFAGSTTNGIIDANGSQAQFKNPWRIALDADGNLYTLDVSDWRIRKITTDADVFVYAGALVGGFADGEKGEAQFRISDGGIVADGGGNIYGADFGNQRIRKISTAGQVSTIAGTGETGFKDGNGESAQFNFPDAIAIDQQGNLYIADVLNFRIRKITPNGQVSTFAGSGVSGYVDGEAGVARFGYVNDIVIDRNGNLYISDEHRIRKISPNGIVSTIAGSVAGFADGDGASAKFNEPTGLGIDEVGDIYVADTFNNRIRKIHFE